MKYNLMNVLLGLAMLLLLSACAALPGSGTTNLAGTKWTISAYGDPASPTKGSGDANVYVDFGKDGAVAGNAGCNQFGGQYNLSGGSKIQIKDLFSTLMACADDALMQQETNVLAIMQNADTFTLAGDTLTLTAKDGKVVVLSLIKP